MNSKRVEFVTHHECLQFNSILGGQHYLELGESECVGRERSSLQSSRSGWIVFHVPQFIQTKDSSKQFDQLVL